MAREDLLVNLMKDLFARDRPQQTSPNTVIQKFTAPTDTMTMQDTVTTSATYLSDLKWGDGVIVTGWVWGSGQWQ